MEQPRQRAERTEREQEPQPLPEWDLSDLYAAPDAPEVQADLEAADQAATALEDEFKGRLRELSGDDLAELIVRYEQIEERLGRAASYAQLLHAANTEDPEIGRFFQTVQERATEVGTKILFVTLELNRIEDQELEAKLAASAKLAHYRPWIRDVRSFRPHQLDDAIEQVLHEKAITGRRAWNRLFDETMAALRFPYDGRQLTSAEIFDLLQDRDRSKRESAARAIADVLGRNVRLFALVTNTLAKDKQLEDGWRKFARPISSRNLANQVEDEVVDALIAAVRAAYPRLSHRYYALKARWLGLERLEYWDRNAPLPEDSDRRVAWADAKVIVLDAYRRFSPRLAEIVDRFFARGWIDAALRPGKDAGAFCHPTVPSVHPYVLMNYQGRPRDVMTLAHELGHGVHQTLAAQQGPLMAGTPLDARRDRLGVRGAAHLPRPARGRDRPGAAADHARRQDRGRAQHRGPADRLRRVRAARARGAARRPSSPPTSSARCGSRSRARAWARRSISRIPTGSTGATSRTSSTCRSTSTPTRSGTAW